jgi:Fic family protein
VKDLDLYRLPSSMTPLFPESGKTELRELVAELERKSNRLTGCLNSTTREAVAHIIEPMNSYYSNLIEGHKTHPLEIERALNKNYSKEPKKKLLQLEGRAHVLVNRAMHEKLNEVENVYDKNFICWLHKSFYDEMLEEFRIFTSTEGKPLKLIPGELRKIEVQVGEHIAPAAEQLNSFMDFFSDNYNPVKTSDPAIRTIALAAAHHRLAWIHPFADGNGRVMRLFSEACLIKEKKDGAGLWSISRGFSFKNEEYYSHLRNADLKRWNDYDGHGKLSDKFLAEFCIFFLNTAIDQTEFMYSLLEPEKLLVRMREFVNVMASRKEFRKESIYILEEVLLKGYVKRGEMPRLTGKSENVARQIMNELLEKGLLVSESNELRSPVRINFPVRYAPYLFPRLYPKDIEATMED